MPDGDGLGLSLHRAEIKVPNCVRTFTRGPAASASSPHAETNFPHGCHHPRPLGPSPVAWPCPIPLREAVATITETVRRDAPVRKEVEAA